MKLCIRGTLLTGFSSAVLFKMIAGSTGFLSSAKLGDRLTVMYSEHLEPIIYITEINMNFLMISRGTYRLIIETEDKEMISIFNSNKGYKKVIDINSEKYNSLLRYDKEIALYKKYQDAYAEYLKLESVFFVMVTANKNAEANSFMKSTLRPANSRVDMVRGDISPFNRFPAKGENGEGTSLIKISSLVAEIDTASGEPSSGIQQNNRAIQQLNTVVQQNASAAEELTATAEELLSRTVLMKGSIEYLKTARRNVSSQTAEI